MKKTVRDVEVEGKRILVRVDFNVPLTEGRVADDTRIRAALPTINYLLDHGAKVILMSHLGRPKGKVVSELRLDPVAERLAELLGRPVRKLDDCVGPGVASAVAEMRPGDVILLENTRFHPGEKSNAPAFARQLASLADIFVNDAFGAAHRAHASVVGVAEYLPSVAGFLMEKEIAILGQALAAPEHPFVAILGGAKISSKIGVIDNLLTRVDGLLIGGGMANTFLKAQGHEVGQSLVEDDSLDVARETLARAGEKLALPVDVVVADRFDAEADSKVVGVSQAPEDWLILDIGPETVELFKRKLAGAKTVVWNGPLGVFEFPRFAEGTFAIARFLADLEATTIIGGGDVVAAVGQAGVADKMTHISTGGGASLEFLEGKELPGLAALLERRS
ncbi:MAG: phosphoglycerate kinase [Anaerolineales bacterium]|nr:phosphoglycerate kinase [Anaerolineales bacterium]